MLKRIYLTILLTLLAAAAASAQAQTATVEYLEGTVEVAQTNNWEMVSFGDTLALTDRVRVAKNSLVEFTYGKNKITITKAGQYLLKDLVSAQQQVSSWQISTLLNQKFKTLTGTDQSNNQSATMGVRGSQSDTKNIEWMYMDEGNPAVNELKQGEELITAAKYEEAVKLFQELLQKGVTKDEEPYLYYYIAYASAQNVQNIVALKYLDKILVKADHPVYADLVLLKGRLLIDSLAFKEALDIFNSYLNSNTTGEAAQSMQLLSAFCYKGLNNPSEQKKSLLKAEKIDPQSMLGKEARRQLELIKN
jgi:tetratricopeptide (TPR) repeat protein